MLAAIVTALALCIGALLFLRTRRAPEGGLDLALPEGLTDRDFQNRPRGDAVPRVVGSDDEGEPEEDENADLPAGRAGRQQRRKNDKARAREERRAEEEARLEALHRKRDADNARRDEEDRKEAEAERAEEEALRKLREERIRKANEEYAQWSGQIEVQEVGEAPAASEEAARLRVAVKDAVTRDKVTVLDTLSRSLDTPVAKIVSCVEELISRDEVPGVFDDRGKFIRITPDEFNAVAKFVRQRGRVSLAELVRECGRLISME